MIDIDQATFRYESAAAPSVRGVTLRVADGECVALVGPSGCGKTTVTRIANGLAPRFYEGDLDGGAAVDGVPVGQAESGALARLVGSVFQDPRSQFFTTDTTSEVAFACENVGLPRGEIIDRVVGAACSLGMADLLERDIFGLSSGQRQRIAIASASALLPGSLVLDEPSANLDMPATAELAAVIGRLKAQGRAVLVAEHRVWYLRDVVDRAIVMEGGRIVDELCRDELFRLSDGEARRRGLRSMRPERLAIPQRESARRGEDGGPRRGEAGGRDEDGEGGGPRRGEDGEGGGSRRGGVGERGAPVRLAFEARGLRFSYRRGAPVLRGTSLRACGGEAIALTGPNGAGKSTLASVLCGLRRQSGGEVLLDGKRLSPARRRKESCFVMQDADYQLFAESVTEELRLGARIDDPAALDGRIGQTLADLDLDGLGGRHPASLSGGQKQRVTIGAAITKGARLMFLDEPTSGLDGDSMRRVAGIVRRLAGEGRIVFVITHDYEFALSCCTRAVRIEGGAVAADVPVRPDRAEAVRAAFFPV